MINIYLLNNETHEISIKHFLNLESFVKYVYENYEQKDIALPLLHKHIFELTDPNFSVFDNKLTDKYKIIKIEENIDNQYKTLYDIDIENSNNYRIFDETLSEQILKYIQKYRK